MKLLILIAAVLALSHATRFTVQDSSNGTCIEVEVAGKFVYTNTESNETISLTFDKATQLAISNCSILKLSFDNEAQVWFDFIGSTKADQMVSLVTAFNPSKIFKDDTTNATVVFEAKSAFQFPQNMSYLCNAEVTTPLAGLEKNVTVQAMLMKFQVQSSGIEGGKFSEAKECSQDLTTPKTTPTTPKTTPTTPKPKPEPKINVYSLKNGNITCINMTGDIAFSITYDTKDKDGKNGSNTVVVAIPPGNLPVTGNCDTSKTEQEMQISFFPNKSLSAVNGEADEMTWKVALVFTEKKSDYSISSIALTYVTDEHLPGAAVKGKVMTVKADNLTYLKASTKGYYTCSSNVTQKITNEVGMSTSHLKYVAFNNATTANFKSGTVSECSQDEETNSIVPIAVGAALAGLVVIVLIAYLIGRRRSKKTGYESV